VNYFNYFTEIEERFQQRRGSILLLSTLDWALIETWREAGIPLAAALRGIDAAFDKRDANPARRRQKAVNGLAWCAQSVMEQAQLMQEAAVGAAPARDSASREEEAGFSAVRVKAHLQSCAQAYAAAGPAFTEIAERLRTLAEQDHTAPRGLEELELALTMLEEKIYALLVTATPDAELVAIREQSARELAPYKRKMQAAQIAQIERQFLNKRLLESRGLPRLSLFYMAHA
jgi:hypothetical protein